MNETDKTVALCVSGFFIILTMVLVYMFIIIPKENDAYATAWVDINSTNSCHSLLLLNQNLISKYPMLKYDDLQLLKDKIDKKMGEIKCP